jgi:hypothetical protein
VPLSETNLLRVAYVHLLIVQQASLALRSALDGDVRLAAVGRIADPHLLIVQKTCLVLGDIRSITFDCPLLAALPISIF